MYENFYGFASKPFQLVPNPAFLYLSPKHENALTYLEYGLMERTGCILLTGEIGTGKTTLIRHLINTIDSSIEPAVIFNTNVTPEELLAVVLSEFEVVPPEPGRSQALEALNRFLIARHAQGSRSLLIIDEAQNLSLEALEEVCMLANLQDGDQILLQIMLVGQPELRTRLRRPELAQLNQRIGVSYHIPHLTQDETAAYIALRIEKAGGKPDIFASPAVDLIYRASRGVPRTINLLCDAALVYGFADQKPIIDVGIIEQAIQDRDGRGLAQPPETIQAVEALAGEASGDIVSRLHAIEQRLHELHLQVDGRIEDLENQGQGFKDELVRRMKERYDRERDRTDKLLFEYARLKEKYITLIKQIDAAKQPPTQPENADLIGRMRDMLNAEREKNRQLQETNQKLREDFQIYEQNRLAELDRENQEFVASTFMEKQRAAKNRSWFK